MTTSDAQHLPRCLWWVVACSRAGHNDTIKARGKQSHQHKPSHRSTLPSHCTLAILLSPGTQRSNSLAASVSKRLEEPSSQSGGDHTGAGALLTASVEHHPRQEPGRNPQHPAAAPQKRHPLCYVVAGVSGSGKTTVGSLLAGRLGCQYFEGDDFHTQENIGASLPLKPGTDSLHHILALLWQEALNACGVCLHVY